MDSWSEIVSNFSAKLLLCFGGYVSEIAWAGFGFTCRFTLPINVKGELI